MDFNAMCKDPNFIGVCSYFANIYKFRKSINDPGFTYPPNLNPHIQNYISNPPTQNYISNPPASNQGNNACNPERFSAIKGSIYDPKDESFKLPNGSSVKILENDDSGPFRIIGPTTATTKDLSIERLNIYYENASNKSEDPGTVTELICG